MRAVAISLAFACATAAPLQAQTATTPATSEAGSSEKLVPADFISVTDSLGFVYNFTSQGIVNDGTDGAYQVASEMLVAGANFIYASRPGRQMTADGSELVLTGKAGTLQVTRRLHVDKKGAYLRYIDTFENPGRSTVDTTVVYRTQLASPSPQFVTLSGSPWNQVLGKNDAGFAALADPSRASLAFILAGPRSTEKPTVSLTNNTTIEIQYTLSCKPGVKLAVMQFLVPRNKMNAGNVATLAGDIAKKVAASDYEVPAAVKGAIVNFGSPSASLVAVQDPKALMQRVETALSDGFQVERGAEDIAIIDGDTRLSGTLAGGDVSITTAYGKATIPLTQIGAWIGGGGTGRPQQLFLRNGETLTGATEVKDLKLTVASGLTIELNPAAMQAIALRRNAELDGKVAPDFGGMVEMQNEDALTLTPKQETTLEAISPWGAVKLGVGELAILQQVREPQPGYRVTLADQSTFLVYLQGKEVALNTSRFGTIKARPQSLASLTLPTTVKPGADAEPPELAWHLIGDTVLAGTIDLPELKITTGTGVTTVDVKKIRLIERRDEEKEGGLRRTPEFSFQLTDGSTITGPLPDGSIPIRSGTRTWRVPASHLISFENQAAPALEDVKKPADESKEPASDAPRSTPEAGGF